MKVKINDAIKMDGCEDKEIIAHFIVGSIPVEVSLDTYE